MAIKVSKEQQLKFDFTITLSDGSSMKFSVTATDEKKAREKVVKNLQEAIKELQAK